MAGQCFITEAEGAQFYSQTSLHVIVYFFPFSVPDPLAHFKPIKQATDFCFCFWKTQKNNQELKI